MTTVKYGYKGPINIFRLPLDGHIPAHWKRLTRAHYKTWRHFWSVVQLIHKTRVYNKIMCSTVGMLLPISGANRSQIHTPVRDKGHYRVGEMEVRGFRRCESGWFEASQSICWITAHVLLCSWRQGGDQDTNTAWVRGFFHWGKAC